jgi:hypothetical protein
MTHDASAKGEESTHEPEDTPAVDSLDEQDIEDREQQEAEQEALEPGCPICQFIEAGPCGEEHKVPGNVFAA